MQKYFLSTVYFIFLTLFQNNFEKTQLILCRFIEDGGWDILNQWLTDFKEIDNARLLTEIMKLYRELPVTVDLLKKNSAAKTIKQLGKSENEGSVDFNFNDIK